LTEFYKEKSYARRPRFKFGLPILWVNKEIRAEALRVLSVTPLVLREPIDDVLVDHALTFAHIIPMYYLNKVRRIQVEPRVSLRVLEELLWLGGKLTKDINEGKLTRNKWYDGLLKLDNPEGNIEISFRGLLPGGAKVIDLGDATVVRESLILRQLPRNLSTNVAAEISACRSAEDRYLQLRYPR
jgi:hypothetical protein